MSKEEYDANHIFSLSSVGFQTKKEKDNEYKDMPRYQFVSMSLDFFRTLNTNILKLLHCMLGAQH